MKNSVRNSLEKAIAGLKKRPEGEVILALHNYFKPDAWVEFPECKEFHTAVLAEPRFELFDNRLQFVTNHGSAVGRRELATWMVKRSWDVGGRQTVDEVWRYLDRKTFQAFQVMLLAGLNLDSDTGHDLGNGLRLIRAHEAPSRYLREIALPGRFTPIFPR
jgi:hypothetical protein